MTVRRPTTLTREILEAYMKLLSDGSCPFIAITADRLGISRSKVENWIWLGTRETDTSDPLIVEFAIRARQIQGDWKARAMKKMETADKADAEAARQLGWLLTRLDRETFDTSRPAKNAPKGESDKPQVPTQESAADASKDLESPTTSH